MHSRTYGEVSFEEMYSLLKAYLAQDRNGEYKVSVGTDSQNFAYTKIPVTIGIHRIENRIGKGGIYFSEIRRVKKISNIRQKIFYETNLSLELAERLHLKFREDKIPNEITIHVDAGYNGPTAKYISEISGWVRACGFQCVIKPDSYMASSVANRLSK
ncbi:ribonuclease H-like YkuK family protein [Desulfosporosinus sp. PR]|uniref:ribonuclease H-like YkuK family protein n=1 Tax=Candidatus Desulfosporosinus nitrosoreducens TaxID=3401928 RepID=UPI0027EEC075|nr:ribonuclease H-like YkuK family protein [Desulfosporosinus sp. PR]MDQ7092528.1 ribonuclease H-like YkuK family protein [Desulfosporosinus sp. PR]